MHPPELQPRRALANQFFSRQRRHVMRHCMRALRRAVAPVIALVLAMTVAPPAQGQAGSVSGVVVDNKTGLPLADAQVAVEGGDIRARTDIKGQFRLNGIANPARLLV